MIATNTTRFFVTNTTRLRAALRRVDPYTLGSIALLLAIVAGGLIGRALGPAAPAPIIVLATPALPGAGAGTVRRLEHAPRAARALPTAVVPTSEPLPTAALPAEPQPITIMVRSGDVPTPAGYIANTTEGPLFVPNDATPVPNDGSYTGPFLAPAASEAPPADAVRYCTGFNDWRDYDPAYAASPVCHQEAP